jgi:ribosome-binding factor A
MPREFSRNLRVGAELQRVLNELLRLEVKDPRLADVHVAHVDLSGDLGVAKVYYALLQPDTPSDEADAAFRKASGFLRHRLGQEVRLRRVPELRFVHDESARHGFEVSHLIDDLAAHDADAGTSETADSENSIDYDR